MGAKDRWLGFSKRELSCHGGQTRKMIFMPKNLLGWGGGRAGNDLEGIFSFWKGVIYMSYELYIDVAALSQLRTGV